MTQYIDGEEAVQKKLFAYFFEQFKQKCGGDEADAISGYLAIKTLAAVLEKALDIDPVEVIVGDDDDL